MAWCLAGIFSLGPAVILILDMLLGDPSWLPHPVVFFGRIISLFDKSYKGERKGKKAIIAGGIPSILLPVAVFVIPCLLICWFVQWGDAHMLCCYGWVFPVLDIFLGYQCLAVKSMRQECRKVYERLAEGDLPGARKAVSRIVGRDTEALTEEGVIRAAVETMAENLSDGVIAPFFYYILGFSPLALAYKAVNTQDSMVGYKNERYLYYGRVAAKQDDLWNYIPARFSALLLMAAAGILKMDVREAWRIWKRDRHKHASPNAGQTEAAAAGALGLKLAGPASYFGKRVEKEWMGDGERKPTIQDIRRMDRLFVMASVLGCLAGCVARLIIFIPVGLRTI